MGRAPNAFNYYDYYDYYDYHDYHDFNSASRYAAEPDGDADEHLLPECSSLLV